MRAVAISMKNETDKVNRLHLDTAACERAYRAVLAREAQKEAEDNLKEQQQACLARTEEAAVAREALKSANEHLDEREKVFSDFRTTAEAKLAGEIHV